MSFTPFAAPLAIVASTGPGGYTMINGTGTIIQWTAPNDGQMHSALVLLALDVTVTEVGGGINVTYTDPAGTAGSQTPIGGAQPVGAKPGSQNLLIGPGTTVAVVQNTALTGGASKLYATIWGA